MAFGRWKERCLHKNNQRRGCDELYRYKSERRHYLYYWIKSYRMDYQNKKYIAGAMIIPKVLCISEKMINK